jgi:hypothetical protein
MSLSSQVTRDVDSLIDAGRFREAIDLLTASNRETRDPEAERSLVELRHRGFTELSTRGRDTWPPEFPDLFAGVTGIPEVTADQLTTETLAAGILHHGSLIVRGLLGRERVDQLTEDIELAFEKHDARRDGAPLTETAPWYAAFKPGDEYSVTFGERWWIRDGGGVWTADSPRSLFDLIDAFEQVDLREILAGYLGEPPVLSVKKCTLRRVPVDSGTDWHQDGSFLGDDIRTVNVWLTLTDCGVDAPGLDVVAERLPGVLETGTKGAQFDWSVGPGLVEEVAPHSVVRPEFSAGDALLFDQRNLHRTGVGPGMTRERYAIETWFFAPSCYPHDQIPIVF